MKHTKFHTRRLLALLLFAAMLFALTACDISVSTLPAPAASAAPAAQTPAPTLKPTPAPTPEPVKEHRYVIERSPLSWVDAQDRCLAAGGYLAVINTRDEFDQITAMADAQGVEFLWIGCHREVASNTLVWEAEGKIDSSVDPNERRMALWAPGEPSFIDGDGTSEDYIILWNHDGGWRYWDSRGDLNLIWGWRDRLAYVCEFDS